MLFLFRQPWVCAWVESVVICSLTERDSAIAFMPVIEEMEKLNGNDCHAVTAWIQSAFILGSDRQINWKCCFFFGASTFFSLISPIAELAKNAWWKEKKRKPAFNCESRLGMNVDRGLLYVCLGKTNDAALSFGVCCGFHSFFFSPAIIAENDYVCVTLWLWTQAVQADG